MYPDDRCMHTSIFESKFMFKLQVMKYTCQIPKCFSANNVNLIYKASPLEVLCCLPVLFGQGELHFNTACQTVKLHLIHNSVYTRAK